MNERYIKWFTPHLSRDFEMLVFGDGGGLPLVLFPTSFGRYSQNKDFGLVDAVGWYIDNGKITLYCPDAIDLESFYNKSIHPADRMLTHNAYERVIVNDVFDFAGARAIALAWRFVARASARITPPTLLFAIPIRSAT
jgi:esterase/lipase superfamily enzyme